MPTFSYISVVLSAYLCRFSQNGSHINMSAKVLLPFDYDHLYMYHIEISSQLNYEEKLL